MPTLFDSINLIRYLIVWRVNSTLVNLPYCFVTDLSYKMVKTIRSRLTTREAQVWKKAENRWKEALDHNKEHSVLTLPDSPWPIQSTLMVYPGKQIYGFRERIFWELKLFNDSADHHWFLEVMLPAMEEAGCRQEIAKHSKNTVWGNFEIDAVYAARGHTWQPVVTAGQLDLKTAVNPGQWRDGLDFNFPRAQNFNHLDWITPFDVEIPGYNRRKTRRTRTDWAPSMTLILNLLYERLVEVTASRHRAGRDIFDEQQRETWAAILALGKEVRMINTKMKPAPRSWPGVSTGRQTFDQIPLELAPYLNLASILHIGRQLHFGCGTFLLS